MQPSFLFKRKVKRFFASFLLALSLLLFFSSTANAIDFLHQTMPGIRPVDVAVVVNSQDVNSLLIGDYYLKARGIPASNLIVVDTPKVPTLGLVDFEQLRKVIDAQLSPNIQVIVLMWTTPYAVNCNSITSAISLGYDAKQCEDGCAVGKKTHILIAPLNTQQTI